MNNNFRYFNSEINKQLFKQRLATQAGGLKGGGGGIGTKIRIGKHKLLKSHTKKK